MFNGDGLYSNFILLSSNVGMSVSPCVPIYFTSFSVILYTQPSFVMTIIASSLTLLISASLKVSSFRIFCSYSSIYFLLLHLLTSLSGLSPFPINFNISLYSSFLVSSFAVFALFNTPFSPVNVAIVTPANISNMTMVLIFRYDYFFI